MAPPTYVFMRCRRWPQAPAPRRFVGNSRESLVERSQNKLAVHCNVTANDYYFIHEKSLVAFS
jgi:hypothetical protein